LNASLISLSKFPLPFYYSHVFEDIGNALHNYMKLDLESDTKKLHKYTHIYFEMDLMKLLQTKSHLNGRTSNKFKCWIMRKKHFYVRHVNFEDIYKLHVLILEHILQKERDDINRRQLKFNG
jgi:hypothetical protein